MFFGFYYSAAALLAMQSAVIRTAIPSVCPSVTRWYPIQTNGGSCGLHCEVAKTLQFSGTKNGWGRRQLPLKICTQNDPPPLKSADFDQYLLITPQPYKS